MGNAMEMFLTTEKLGFTDSPKIHRVIQIIRDTPGLGLMGGNSRDILGN
jgi:hypothetical protein